MTSVQTQQRYAQMNRHRRISISTHPSFAMPAQWSDNDLSRELIRFEERKTQIKDLQDEHEVHAERIRKHFEHHNITTVTIVNSEFKIKARTTKVYSRHLAREEERLKNQIKASKKQEEENAQNPEYDGPHQCVIEENKFHHLEVRRLEGSK